MMPYANAFIALRRLRRGEVVDPRVLVMLRRRGLVRGPLCIKRESNGPRGRGRLANVWERVWSITSDGYALLDLIEGALSWMDTAHARSCRQANVTEIHRHRMRIAVGMLGGEP